VAKQETKDNPDKKIEELKRRVEELCDGQMDVGISDDCPAEMEESFWKYVLVRGSSVDNSLSPVGDGRRVTPGSGFAQ
jgi:hypothetical protein